MANEAVNPEFDRYILETGESDKIDAKGPMAWDNGPKSAGLAKDIAAFANSKDGGVIVIGKSEGDDGSFVLAARRLNLRIAADKRRDRKPAENCTKVWNRNLSTAP